MSYRSILRRIVLFSSSIFVSTVARYPQYITLNLLILALYLSLDILVASPSSSHKLKVRNDPELE